MRGTRVYEASNHLGNVLLTFSDRKVAQPDGSYKADVTSANDYYAFGMTALGRSFTGQGYRFGFNGMEKNEEITLNDYTTDARLLDSRIGRWWSIDPLAQKYMWQSPYCSFDNNPIYIKDPSGEGGEVSNVKSSTNSNGTKSYTADVKINIYLYTDQANVSLANYKTAIDRAVKNDLRNTPKNVMVTDPETKKAVSATANIIVNVQVVPNFQQAVSMIKQNKSTVNNFIYVDNNMAGRGEYANGNSAWFEGGISQKNISHAIMHLLDYRPTKDAEIGSHNQNPASVMYGRTTAQNANAFISNNDWTGINNYKPLDNRKKPGAESSPFGCYMNNVVYSSQDVFILLDKKVPQSTPLR